MKVKEVVRLDRGYISPVPSGVRFRNFPFSYIGRVILLYAIKQLDNLPELSPYRKINLNHDHVQSLIEVLNKIYLFPGLVKEIVESHTYTYNELYVKDKTSIFLTSLREIDKSHYLCLIGKFIT